MKITIASSGGTLRSKSLSHSIDKRNYLSEFYIPYYDQKYRYLGWLFGKKAAPNLISARKVHVNSLIFLLQIFLHKIGIDRIMPTDTSKFICCELFDRYVSKRISSSADIIFVEWLMALHTIRRAKELGIITVLDRTNSHIQNQADIMKKEYLKFGINAVFNSPAAVEKSLIEYEEADYITVLSSFAKKTFLERRIPEKKLLLIPPGIDLTCFKPVQKEDDVFRIIYCGAICIKKGVHYLLEALKQLSLKNAELWLIGGVYHAIKPLLKNYEGYYKIIGPFPSNELQKYFSQGSVFVLPSLEEGLAKVIIEAMACGLAVIATPNTGAEDVMRDNVDGFIIPVRDVEALKEKILYMYENQNICREMGRNASEKVQSGFACDDYAQRFIQACEKVYREKRNS